MLVQFLSGLKKKVGTGFLLVPHLDDHLEAFSSWARKYQTGASPSKMKTKQDMQCEGRETFWLESQGEGTKARHQNCSDRQEIEAATVVKTHS